jgi:outer membrane protein
MRISYTEVSGQQKFNRWTIGLVVFNILISAFTFVYNASVDNPIVYVDAARLLSKYTGMEDARKVLQSQSAVWQANLDTLKNEMDVAVANFEKNKGKASASEGKLMEELAKTKQQQFMMYEQSIKEQYQNKDREISQDLLKKVNEYIKSFGDRHGYTIILAATHYGNIAYASESLDITEVVLQGLNTEYRKASNREN